MRALITGASGKIGGEIRDHLNGIGWKVIAPTHDEMWVEYAKHVNAYMADLLEIDLLVCAHGLYGDISSVEDSDTAMWREAIAVNLIGTYNVCRAAIPKFRAGAQIITLSGGGGMLDPMPMISSYACSKAGIVSLTKTLAVELAGRVNCNVIFPGMQDSKIHDRMMRMGAKADPHYSAIKKMRESGVGGVPVRNTLRVIDKLISEPTTGQVYYAREWGK